MIVYVWNFSSPLKYVSTVTSVSHSLNYCSYLVNFESEKDVSVNFVLLPYCLGSSRSSAFPHQFQDQLVNFYLPPLQKKNLSEISILCWSCRSAWEELPILNFLIHEHSIYCNNLILLFLSATLCSFQCTVLVLRINLLSSLFFLILLYMKLIFKNFIFRLSIICPICLIYRNINDFYTLILLCILDKLINVLVAFLGIYKDILITKITLFVNKTSYISS